jgi:hypothetical protein
VRFLCVILLTLIATQAATQPGTASKPGISFRTVDIYLDPQAQPLAAYQLELVISGGDGKLVGVEGGAHRAFAEPPFYDPQAIQRESVILAAFNTAAAQDLPSARTRVASVHLRVLGKTRLTYAVKVTAAASIGGKKITVVPTVEERNTQ